MGIWKLKDCIKARVLAVLVAAVSIIIFCAIQMIQPSQEYVFENEVIFQEGVAAQLNVYERIALPPGVYKVELEYATNTDLSNICNVVDGTVYEGGLLSNGEHLYSGKGKTDFRFWLLESTDNLQINVSYGGVGQLQTGRMTIYNTKQLWSIIVTLTIAASVVIIGILFWKDRARRGLINTEQKTVFFLLCLIALIASIPYLLGKSVSGVDLTYHLQRIEGVKDGLLSGQFPVRLEPEWLYGHGYANSIFYCNTLLFFPAILRLAGFTVTTSYNMYCIALNILTVFISYYCFSKIFKDKIIGVCCCSLYTLSIFRIYKLVITSAVGEGSAVTFMPLVFYGLYRVFTEDIKSEKYRTSWIPITLGYTGLIQTHVLSCEITAFLQF